MILNYGSFYYCGIKLGECPIEVIRDQVPLHL